MAKSIYFYEPSLAASIIFTILYTLPLGYHLYVSVIAPRVGKYGRTGYFIPILIGAAIEVAAYAIRAASVKKPDDVGLYATSATLIVIAPVLVCASLYILIGRLIQSSGVQQVASDGMGKRPFIMSGKISPVWIPRIFVTLDILSFLTQASGSGIASSNDWTGSTKDAGIGVLVGGLALQLVTFAFFLVLVVWYDVHMVPPSPRGEKGPGVRLMLNGIYVAGFFITVRLIYRVIEFSMGIETYTWTHEWPLYVLEAVPMFVAMMALGWYHPARCLPSGLAAMSTELRSPGRDSD